MNGKTAKLVRKVASRLALLEVARRKKMNVEVTAVFAPRVAKSALAQMKARWKGTPRPERGKLRAAMQHFVMTVDHAVHSHA